MIQFTKEMLKELTEISGLKEKYTKELVALYPELKRLNNSDVEEDQDKSEDCCYEICVLEGKLLDVLNRERFIDDVLNGDIE